MIVKNTYQNKISGCRKYAVRFFILLMFGLTLSTINGQEKISDTLFTPNLQIGISAGPSVFFGDLKQNPFVPSNGYINEWRFAYGLNANFNISQVFTLRMQGLYGELAGSREEDNIWFENDYYEFNLNTTININNLFSDKRNNRLVTVYGVAGFGIVNYNTVVKRIDEYYVLKRVGYGYGTGVDGRYRQEFLLFGIGIDFRINKRFNVLVESANKMPFNDILDGFESGHYNDLYNYTSVGITYRFAFLKSKTRYPAEKQSLEHLPLIDQLVAKNIEYEVQKVPEVKPVIPQLNTQETVNEAPSEQEVSLIEYRVQVLAEYGKPYPISGIGLKYGLPLSEIKQERDGYYYIYTVGSFPNYSKAMVRCLELRDENGITGAFVVAFKDGKRIFPVK